MKKVSLNYLRRVTGNYELTLEQAKQMYGNKFDVQDVSQKNFKNESKK